MTIKKLVFVICRSLLVIGISYVILYPLVVKLSVSLMSAADLKDPMVKWFAKSPTFTNFSHATEVMEYGKAFLNTFILTVIVTLLQVLSCTLAAYGYARLKFKFSGILFALTIFTLVVPPSTYMISSYMQFRFFDPLGIVTLIKGDSGILNSYLPFVLKAVTASGIRCGLYIYIMRQFFRGLPKELEEASMIDGAGTVKTFFSVILPNSKTSLMTIAMFSFVWQWNDDYFTSLLAPDMKFLTTGLGNLQNELFLAAGGGATQLDPLQVSSWLNAGALITIIPIILLFVISQKYFVQGMEHSGITGI